jgi:hypothetical protein
MIIQRSGTYVAVLCSVRCVSLGIVFHVCRAGTVSIGSSINTLEWESATLYHRMLLDMKQVLRSAQDDSRVCPNL